MNNLIEKYRRGTLTRKERVEFEKSLKQDKNLQEELQTYDTLVAGIKAYERAQLKELLQSPSSDKAATVISIKRKPRNTWMLVAATVVGVLLTFQFYQDYTSNTRLFDEFALNEKVYNAMSATSDELDTSKEFYQKGLMALGANEDTKALEMFGEVMEDDVNTYFKAQYQIALLLIKNGKKQEAKRVLSQLTEREEHHFLKEKAAKLLEKLN